MPRKAGIQYLDKMKTIEAELKENNWIKAVNFDRNYQYNKSIIGCTWSRFARRNITKFKFTIEKKYGRIYFVSNDRNVLEKFNSEFDNMLKIKPPKRSNTDNNLKQESINNLMEIPGVGKSLAQDLYSIGIKSIEELKGQDSEELYKRLNRNTGTIQDKCVLYVFRCCVYYANTEPEQRDSQKLKWWYWKDSK